MTIRRVYVRRMTRLLARAAVASFAALVVASCTAASDASKDSTANDPSSTGHEIEGAADAVWALGPGQHLDGGSTAFTALVTRLGCNDGVTGDVVEPLVETSRSRIVVTFQVTPGEPEAARCPSNGASPYVVEVGEPMAGRQLVDGRCLPGGAAETTSFCDLR